MRALILLLASVLAAPAYAQRTRADLSCRLTGTDFIYDCVLRLTRGARPLVGAQVIAEADMPSMPKMHPMVPATAVAGARPGEYVLRFDLEMTGEWAIDLGISGPVRDRIRLRYQFDETGARPVRPRSPAPR